MKIRRAAALVLLLLPLGGQFAWAGNRQSDAIVGAVVGGALGGIVGSQVGGRDGAVVGVGIGALAGAVLTQGSHDDRSSSRYYDDRHYLRDRGYRGDRGYRVERARYDDRRYRGGYDRHDHDHWNRRHY